MFVYWAHTTGMDKLLSSDTDSDHQHPKLLRVVYRSYQPRADG